MPEVGHYAIGMVSKAIAATGGARRSTHGLQ
jgi:hypothetical protein